MRLVVYHGNQGSRQSPNRIIFKGQQGHLGIFSSDEKFEGENEYWVWLPSTLTAPNTESDKDALANVYQRRMSSPVNSKKACVEIVVHLVCNGGYII